VKWKLHSSDYDAVTSGVPQGSALGPQLFYMYIAPLAGLIKSFGVRYHQFVNDGQLFVAISNDNRDIQLATLEQCLLKVHEWLLHNGLFHDPDKSCAVQFVTGRWRGSEVDVTSISVSGVSIEPAASVKSLGITLDNRLSLDQHVTDVCKACYYHIRTLCHLRDSLPDDVAKIVVVSIITSRLDYCNSLFFGMSAKNFSKL